MYDGPLVKAPSGTCHHFFYLAHAAMGNSVVPNTLTALWQTVCNAFNNSIHQYKQVVWQGSQRPYALICMKLTEATDALVLTSLYYSRHRVISYTHVSA